MNACTVYLSCFLIEFLTVGSASDAVLVALGGEEMASDWENLKWLLRADFLPFLFAFLEAIKTISLMFIIEEMFTILKGLGVFSSPDMPVRYYLLHGSLTCFGVTVSSSVLKSY